MKKIISIILATTLALVLALGSLSCAASSASTTTPPATTPPTTTPGTTTPPAVIPGQEIAEEFIKNSATFQFDGIEGSIKLIKDLTDTSTSPGTVLLSFEFQTAHPGHGDRTGQVLAQAVTFHTVIVQVDLVQEKVVSGVCDKVWDMVEDKVVVPEPVESLALGAIETSNTFKFDGIPESLKVVNVKILSLSHTPSPGYGFTIEFQTRQPGHGDRTGEMLAQVITNHSAEVVIANGKVLSAICDETYDLLEDRTVPITVSGIVIEGGDTTPADGPQDAPRVYVFKVQKDDGTFVNVSYTAYPPSPAADEQKFNLELHDGVINTGDRMQARGMYDAETNTVIVAEEGDYIKTFPNKILVEGTVIEGGDTTAAGDPEDNPRVFIYKIQKDDGSFVNVSYTIYPPSSSGEDHVRFTLSLYDESGIKNGDLMKAYGTYDMGTNTVTAAEEDDFIKVEYIQR